MSAAARAEARRKAILSRGGDRLAKLTSSARGEDAPAYMHDDPPLAPLPDRPTLETFVGEQTIFPTPPPFSRTSPRPPRSQPANTGNGMQQPLPPQEQFRQLQEALASGGPFPSMSPSENDPLAALMSTMSQPGGMSGMPSQKAAVIKPKTRLQRLMPFIHLLASWILLAYFVIWKEPDDYNRRTHGSQPENAWRRWAELGWKDAGDTWGVQPVPFFWAFTTLAIVLHSWRMFSKLDTPQLPTLLTLALPHLPPPVPSLITNGYAYLQIGGVFLDDISGLLVSVGLLIWVASWFAD
ncbi:uncharacterized protein FIBRA_08755 [Fibroporia radiculosa]|uniref:Golgi to ER traffic protein 2 n=1 Tax=Fibroporia radiculosa TaxID=599839 RepID=J4ICI8_9APHY|nr:uncharacterized protein FIBRA_08755 [Fibroporia radiculosa]CCM06486.1 predicted protein [Fibroporia radiculosa]